jgi:hypothetical protein
MQQLGSRHLVWATAGRQLELDLHAGPEDRRVPGIFPRDHHPSLVDDTAVPPRHSQYPIRQRSMKFQGAGSFTRRRARYAARRSTFEVQYFAGSRVIVDACVPANIGWVVGR